MKATLAASRVIAAKLTPGFALAGPGEPGHHHSHDAGFSAGQPGDPKKPARIIQVTMREGDGKMMFLPDRVEVKRGEQVRFMIRNGGLLAHEFILATTDENLKHAAEMMKNPEM